MMMCCASRSMTYGVYPGWRVHRTGRATPGCHCGRCMQLNVPALYALAQVMNAIACAVMMADLVPHLCWGLKR
jgi:hypothetical protein